jgi:coproporphyrinogen III oxidase-like Fe-S oxidoreductase
LEFFLLGLRTSEGISGGEYAERFGAELGDGLTALFRRYDDYGCLLCEEDRIRLTKKGFLFADELLAEIAQSLAVSDEHFTYEERPY